jgi:hypothetical protein
LSFNNISYSSAIGYRAIVDASNTIMLGGLNNIYPSVIVPGNQSIGKRTSPLNALDVSGNVAISGTVNALQFNLSSDYRIKENVHLLDNTFTVDAIRPVTYFNTMTNKQDIGVIAHELAEVFPN